MVDQTEKANNKRHHEDVVEPKQKHQRQGGEVEMKTLTNIYYDCLERIFDFLDLGSLLNVAGTCKRLQIAAIVKFGDEYGSNVFSVSNCTPNEVKVSGNSDIVQVNGMKFGFPFLRCFGAKLSSLRVFYSRDNDIKNELLDRYINQYCADSLTMITYVDKCRFSAENFSKPFQNVAEIRAIEVKVRKNLPNFVNWFPNLRRLRMRRVVIDETAIAVSFPHLEHLTVKVGGNNKNINNRKKDFTLENFASLLHANRRLQNLAIVADNETTLDQLLKAISRNTSILNLSMATRITNVNMIDLKRLANEHSSMERLNFTGYRLTADIAIMLTRQLNALKQFQFEVNNRSEHDRLFHELNGNWEKNVSLAGNQYNILLNR